MHSGEHVYSYESYLNAAILHICANQIILCLKNEKAAKGKLQGSLPGIHVSVANVSKTRTQKLRTHVQCVNKDQLGNH